MNPSAALVFEFCYRVIQIGRSYFGKLDEDSVKNNFVLIYELLDGKLSISLCLKSVRYIMMENLQKF